MGYIGHVRAGGVTPKDFTHLNHSIRGASLGARHTNPAAELARHMDGRQGRTYYIGQGPAPKGQPELAIPVSSIVTKLALSQKLASSAASNVQSTVETTPVVATTTTTEVAESMSSEVLGKLLIDAAGVAIPPLMLMMISASASATEQGFWSLAMGATALTYAGLNTYLWGRNPENGNQFEASYLWNKLKENVSAILDVAGHGSVHSSLDPIMSEMGYMNAWDLEYLDRVGRGEIELPEGLNSSIFYSLGLTTASAVLVPAMAIASVVTGDVHPGLIGAGLLGFSGSGLFLNMLENTTAGNAQAELG